MSEMKLFVWPTVKALRQYGDGITFALAPDKESAIEAILKRYWKEQVEPEIGKSIHTSLLESHIKIYIGLSEELKAEEPLVVEDVEGFWVYGTA